MTPRGLWKNVGYRTIEMGMLPYTSDLLHPVGVQEKTNYAVRNTERLRISREGIPFGCEKNVLNRRSRG